jgi:hypothetical protein
MSVLAVLGPSFVLEHLRTRLTLVLLVAIPVFFVLIFASVLGDFSAALGGELAGQAAIAISAGWGAAFLSGSLAFFEVVSSRGADRRLALAGLGAARVALARIAAALSLAIVVSAVAFLTLALRSGIAHPLHAAVAILGFAMIYIGIGALVGAFVAGPLEGSLLVILVFSVDTFAGPAMTDATGLFAALTPSRKSAELLVAAAGGQGSPTGDWLAVALIGFGALGVALAAFWLTARARG